MRNSISSNKITSTGGSVLFNCLRDSKSYISALNVYSNKLDDGCMKSLGEYIQNNGHLKAINIGGNYITNKGVKILTEYLIGNTVLNVLDLSDSMEITMESTPYLIEIAKKSHIISLYTLGLLMPLKKSFELQALISIPIDQREIPIISHTKSASKISESAST